MGQLDRVAERYLQDAGANRDMTRCGGRDGNGDQGVEGRVAAADLIEAPYAVKASRFYVVRVLNEPFPSKGTAVFIHRRQT